MDIDFDDIFSVPVAKPASTASKFRPNANRPVLRKGLCAPANTKQGTSNSLEPATTVNNVQNVVDHVDVHDHEEGVSQSSNSNEIDRQESILESQGPTILSNMSLGIEKDLVIPIQDLLESSSFEVTDDTQSETFPDFTVVQESVTCEEDSLLFGRDSQIDKETIETDMEAEVFPGLATIESFPDSMATSNIGQHMGKFIPKKMNGGLKKPDSGLQHAEAKKDHILVDFETDFANEGLTPSSVFDYSSLMLDESTPGGQVSQTPDSETLKDCSEPSRFDASISIEAETEVDPGVLGHSNRKNAKRDVTVPDSFQEPVKSSNGSADNEVPKSSSLLKNRGAILHHVGESDDVAQNSDGIAGEANMNATGEETLSQMKKGARKSKTTRTKNEKTIKKRKNGDDTVLEKPSEEQEPPKKKKFAHSTQRRKRCVDKVLLQTPEEDIDYQKLCMRDLILLAEHKEKLAKKAKMPKTSSGSVSTKKSVDGDDSHNKESTVSSEENEALDRPTDNVEPIITLFNYQSFMNKTPTTKWSKQDTELFYEGIRQFGTDLGMIKELFPDLTRHQIKLKYKKEERQNPLRLSEAIHGRAKDHRHFELVIERLQAANKAETESNADDSAAMPGDGADEGGEEESESNGEANNEEASSSMPEKEEKKETKDEEADHGNFDTLQNQKDDDEEEIDEDFFSSYKTEF